ncbi:sigma-E factor negative regulatory protein [Nitrosomonas sp.]|uniref:sigma-E factor negative regulatory protein n=1 Tax=Nitrosomonas sp. TaxID=42353 RepID=UPI001D849BE9|nr:sigma-E factor negative regulatory protein [Nitrosomonas sp.]MCB1948611.1 sigma-E factor negative regulatory protein [Nitrosomonas sp.]MCP5242208.1 sigma-E factor negative regulatory protein [Burkholderiales bacterium]MDR4514210.1 sigma-E factor negative regulatory protein [Nitrosomonas sp.]
MKNKVSELMDGELDSTDASKIIEALKKEQNLHQEWEIYHLIGDILRQPDTLPTNLTQRVRQQLDTEPTVLRPNKPIRENSKTKVFAFATAASVVAMVSAWLVMNDVYLQTQPIVVAEQSNNPAEVDKPAATSMLVNHPQVVRPYQAAHPYLNASAEEMSNYLFYHNFQNHYKDSSSGQVIHSGQSTYIYPVTDSRDNFHNQYGR